LVGGYPIRLLTSTSSFSSDCNCTFGSENASVPCISVQGSKVITCVAPRKFDATIVDVRVTDGLLGAALNALLFQYVETPQVDSLRPSIVSAGSISIVTLQGRYFSSGIGIWFRLDGLVDSALVRSDTVCTCMIGSSASGNVTLEISTDGVQFFRTNLQLIIQPMSGIVSITPTLGNLQRGLRVSVYFPSISSIVIGMFCSLETNSSSVWGSASLQFSGRVLCSFSSCGDCPIGFHSISINVDSAVWGRKSGAFQHIPMWSVSALQPSIGQITGGAKVTVSGTNFDVTSVCLFGGNSTQVATEYTSPTRVTCIVPPKGSPGSVLVSIIQWICTFLVLQWIC